MPDDDKHTLQYEPDAGLDHDPALGDPEDPAEDRVAPVPLDGGLPVPTAEISGEDPDPSTLNQLPISGGVNWQSPTDPVTGYADPRDRERASQLPKDVVPNAR
jgi:hypothetical protein